MAEARGRSGRKGDERGGGRGGGRGGIGSQCCEIKGVGAEGG